ncbi:acyltransferase [Neiella marina]|uniref:Acyltransferase n=1 Tax=Neiella marina TaxID=508461 RepID=A0A8J2U1Z6_9GAMM|nr:acyltransferase [Neiella marina]GGA64776.1 acyltransferase [Neiella marina]
MLSFLPGVLRGALGMFGYAINTVFWSTPLILLAILKLLIPIAAVRKLLSRILNWCASSWISVNSLIQKLFLKLSLEIEVDAELSTKARYLVIANHQSWVDILILQRVLNGRIPFLKFFLKKELLYVPLLGIAWWALDFPFMQRYSKSFIKKNPHLAGKDIETTRKACEKFKQLPVSIMNFVEGTRFTPEKHQRQKSPFKHLLKPKAGGIAFVLSSMGEQLHSILDITISYDTKRPPTMWEFVCGKLSQCKVHVRAIEIDDDLTRDYAGNSEHRVAFQRRINQIWADKDERLDQLAESNTK